MENKAYQYPDCIFVEYDKDKDYLCIKYDPETIGKKIRFKIAKYAKDGEYIPSRIIDIDDNQEYDVKLDNNGACYYITNDAINYIILG